MPRETTYHAIILKKQPLGEADELITVFSQETGKVRLLAKAVKSPKSKLQHALQSAFLVNLRATRSRLPKIISAQVEETFAGLRKSLPAMKLTMYAAELAVKFTADEHKNQNLFAALLDFLHFLNHARTQKIFLLGLAKFKIAFLEAVGFKIHADRRLLKEKKLNFSNNRGGFTSQQATDAMPVSPGVLANFLALSRTGFAQLESFHKQGNLALLQELLSGFLEYHLESKIKSESLLDFENMV